MSLANKYRPKNFDTIIAQEHITDILKAQMKSDSDSNHNYLFFGLRGTGKTSAARILARALNCLDPQDGNPCNKCANCTTIMEGKTLDYVEIDAASHTGIDNIRDEILSKAAYPPTQLKKKIYVIDEVHMLSKGAFNALLKTIEEPKDNVCFILATTEIHKVPDTIISRCQVFNFKKVLGDDMTGLIENICKAEGLKYDAEALNLISRISEGSVRDAVKYVDQVSVFGDVNEKNVTNFLGIAGESVIKDFLDLIKTGDRDAIFTKIDDIQNQGIDLVQFAKQNIMYIDQNLMNDTDFLLEISEAFSEIIGTIKYYPYPTMVYKIEINKHIKKTNNIQNTVIASPATQATKTADVAKVQDIPEASKQGTVEQKQTPIVVGDDDIMKSLIASIDSNILKGNLKDHTIIKSIGENKVEFIVINKMAEMLLNKEDTKKMIEQKLFEITGKKLYINIEFQDKDDYFASQM